MAQPKLDCHECESHCIGSLTCLPEDILEQFNISKSPRVYKAGQIIFYEDNKPFGVYCVERGKIKLTKYTPDGKSYIARIAKAGDLLGYRAFLTHEPYSATAEVLEEATVCFLERDLFLKALKEHPGFAFQLMEQLGNDLKTAENRARDMAYKSVPERLAELLLAMKETYGSVNANGDTRLDIRLTREEMASLLGTTVETTVRNLTRFKQKGLIAFEKKDILLKDIRGLAEYIPSL
ncbi:MAG: Crp/Fnr family transcriptional regulator [Candidatus Sericytochromatia bacterium]|nr:Crp/Fnr family transcriptional regulator [Candidatus Sericytochromatia bacterium]